MARRREEPDFYIAILGGYSVGKTGLVLRLISEEFPVAHEATIEESYTKRMDVDNESALVSILDTAGHSDFFMLLNAPMQTHDGFLLVYDVTKRSSFEHVRVLASRILEQRRQQTPPPTIIVASKTDHKKHRIVSEQSGVALAKELGALDYIETSAKDDVNCKEAFSRLLAHMIHGQMEASADASQQQLLKGSRAVVRGGDTDADKLCSETTLCYGLCSLQPIEFQVKHSVNLQELQRDAIPEDLFPQPVLSLKNFQIDRSFSFWLFAKTFAWLPFLPFRVFYQTLGFLTAHSCYFPLDEESAAVVGDTNSSGFVDYSKVQQWAFHDILGLVVGRDPSFDPEGRKNRDYFVLQTRKQLIIRLLLTLLIFLLYAIVLFNVKFARKSSKIYSIMETTGPLLLLVFYWSLFSSWAAYKFGISDDLPPLSKLRGVQLLFGEDFRYKTTVYTFLRSYWRSKDQPYVVTLWQAITCISVGLLYALIPGFCRIGFEDKSFWPEQYFELTFGAFLVNLAFVSGFIYTMFRQYSGKFAMYKLWFQEMSYFLSLPPDACAHDATTTKVVSLPTATRPTRRSQHRHTITDMEIHKEAAGIALNEVSIKKPDLSVLFLSFRRKSNIVGWLDLRAYLGMEGSLLFGQQELPTLWLLVMSVFLALFLTFRVYFVKGASYKSTLWMGLSCLALVCLVTQLIIANSSRVFHDLQQTQERLIAEQKFFLKCDAVVDDTGLLRRLDSLKYGKRTQAGASAIESKYAEDGDSELDLDVSMELSSSEAERVYAHVEKGKAKEELEQLLDDSKKMKSVKLKTRLRANDAYSLDFVNTAAEIVSKKQIRPNIFGAAVDDVMLKSVFLMLIMALLCLLKMFVSQSHSDETTTTQPPTEGTAQNLVMRVATIICGVFL